jgi:RNA polymerase nonessential primary-like sigma factor
MDDKKKDPWESAYDAWKLKPTPEAMGSLLEASEPVLQSAIQSYGKGNKALYSRARQLAAKAYQGYDPNKGTKLRTHVMTQLQPLTRHAHEMASAVHIPERTSQDLYLLGQAKSHFIDSNGREPTDQELADNLGLSQKRIRHIRRQGGELAESSLVEVDEGGEAGTAYPGLFKEDPEKVWLEYVHHDLSPMDQQILRWRTGLHGDPVLSNNEIASRLKLTPGAISQRAAKIAARLSEGSILED